MPYTARELITNSWFLSGIVARNLQGITGDQATDGLRLLNNLLDFKQIETDLIPYYTYNQTINCVPGQEKYFIPNCAQIQSLTFNLGTIRFSMDYITQANYFGCTRIDNVSSLPFDWTFVRELGGGYLYLYFLPEQSFPLNIFGKFFLVDVTLDQDISLVYDTSYIEYLRYALAQFMCSEYGVSFNPESEKIMMKYQRKLMYLSPPDLSMKKRTILGGNTFINFGDCNLGLGWRP